MAGLATMIRDATASSAAEVRIAQAAVIEGEDELRAMLEQQGRKRRSTSTSRVDPALIGGFVAKIGSEVYDASVSGKIEKFRESLA